MVSVSSKAGHGGSAWTGRTVVAGSTRACRLPGRPHVEPATTTTDLSLLRIVVPVLDEAQALPALLTELCAHDLLRLTIFVDNGSSDEGPQQIARAGAVLLREPRRGYGYPCLSGTRAAAAAGAKAIVFMEADGTDDPAQVRALAGPVLAGRSDLVIGSRHDAAAWPAGSDAAAPASGQ